MSNNGNKKGKNAFSDLNVDGMDDKYTDRNNSAVRRERADELLARVKTYEAEVNTLHGAFMKGNHGDAKWEKIAYDISAFCSREVRENADIIGIAGDAEKRLEKLRALSEKMLKEIEMFKKHAIIDVDPPDIEKRKIAEAKAKARAEADKAAKAGKGGNSASAFADLSLDGMDKYHARNAEAHRIKRAAELDDRIRAFAARKKDAAWIAEADDFCAREELANKDVFSISKEAYRLPLILEEAVKLKKLADENAIEREKERLAKIKADAEAKAVADKLANDAKIAKAKAGVEEAKFLREKEAEEAKLKAEREAREAEERLRQIEAEAAEQALRDKLNSERLAEAKARAAAAEKEEIASRAAKSDELVKMLASSPRSRFWCEEVDKAAQEINALPRESRILMKSLAQLEELVDEAKNLREAAAFDKRIERLDDVPQNRRKAAWAEEVLACEADLVRVNERMLKELATLKRLVPVATRAKYDESIKAYEKAIRDVGSYSRNGVPQSVCDSFARLDGGLTSLEYAPADYINNFKNKWDECRSAVRASENARDEAEKQAAKDKAKAKAQEEERQRLEAKAKREREEENARERIAEEYRLILAAVESGSFDDSIESFEALYQKRSTVGFSLAQRINDFEKRMVAAKQAVDNRKREINTANQLRKEAAKQAAAKARKEAETRARRQAAIDAIVSHLALIISLGIVVIAGAGLVIAGLLVPELAQTLIPIGVFVVALYFTSCFGPIVLKEMYHPALVISLKSVCAVAGLVLTFMPELSVYGMVLFAVVVVGSALEYLLVSINKNFENSKVSDDEWTKVSGITCAAIGAMLVLLNLLVDMGTSAAWLVLCMGIVFLAYTIYFLVITEGCSEFNWLLIGVALAAAFAGFVLMFFSRELALIGLFMALSALASAIAFTVATYNADYDENHFTFAIVALILSAVISLIITIMYFSYWGTKDYSITADGVLTGVYVHNDESVLYLPEEVDGITVVAIGEGVFNGYSNNDGKLKTVVLPDTVKTLCYQAFFNCAIPTVILNDGLEVIENEAFYWASSTKLGYPENYEIPEGMTEADLPDNYIPDTVTSIGAAVFQGSGFEGSLVIPESCTSVGSRAFAYSDFSEVDLSSVKNIGEYMFEQSEVRSVKLNETLTTLPMGLFCDAGKLTDVTLPEGIKAIPEDCFKGCEMLAKIDIPESVTVIGKKAFYWCSILTEIHIENVETIENEAFNYVGSTFDIYLGTSFRVMGKSIFWGSTSGLTIHYSGTSDEWAKIDKNGNFNIDNVIYG